GERGAQATADTGRIGEHPGGRGRRARPRGRGGGRGGRRRRRRGAGGAHPAHSARAHRPHSRGRGGGGGRGRGRGRGRRGDVGRRSPDDALVAQAEAEARPIGAHRDDDQVGVTRGQGHVVPVVEVGGALA